MWNTFIKWLISKHNNELLNTLNITKWHEAGYKGNNIRAITAETKGDKHDLTTREIYHIVAPESNLEGYKCNPLNSVELSGLLIKVKLDKIPIMFRSLGTYSADISRINDANLLLKANPNFTIVNAIGNGAEAKHDRFSVSEYVTSVGSVYKTITGKIKQTYYSSVCMYLDCVSYSKIRTSTYPFGFAGTSGIAPIVAGMYALVQQKCYEDNGKYLNRDQLYDFTFDNCKDILNKGHDFYSGHGLFILPDPDKINWLNYINN